MPLGVECVRVVLCVALIWRRVEIQVASSFSVAFASDDQNAQLFTILVKHETKKRNPIFVSLAR